MSKILVIDDDKITHAFVKRALDYKFDLFDAYNGEQGLAMIEATQPDIILLDVEMPGINGYEVCEKIRANPKAIDIPVIFLSARAELRDRMQGFEAGADDYMVKPFHPEHLLAKINVLIQYHQRRHELVQQVDEARKTAFIAISNSSDLGQAINFIERTHTLHNFEQLARAIFTVTQAMQLKCTVMIKTSDQALFFSSTHNSVSPMESELVANLATEKRFFDFGCRTQINFPYISLLVKNMPLDDMERYGRIKDFFPAMLSTADIKISQICSQLAIKAQMEETRQTFVNITEALDTIKDKLDGNQKQGVKILRNMLMEMDKQLPGMALDEDQEQYILDQIDSSIEKAHQAISANRDINQSFNDVLASLKYLLVKQQELEALLVLPDIADNDDEGYQMDIELF